MRPLYSQNLSTAIAVATFLMILGEAKVSLAMQVLFLRCNPLFSLTKLRCVYRSTLQ